MKTRILLLCIAAVVHTAFGAIRDVERVDCHPDKDATEEACTKRGCLWNPPENSEPGVPWCFTPENYGYQMIGQPIQLPFGYHVTLRRQNLNTSYFGNDFDDLSMEVSFHTDYRLRIRISPPGSPRYQVPLKINYPPVSNLNPLYRVEFLNSPAFAIKVIRKSTETAIFDTSLGGLTFDDQFLQFSTRLPSTNVYGIGENEQHTFKHNFTEYAALPLWARDLAPSGNLNLYGVHPYYTVVEDTQGNTHSVMILNSNAQEFVRTPAPGFIYRTLGGLLDIFIFMGPTPEETAKQFTEAIGRSQMPPYWGLGFQLCRWGYNTIENMKAAVDRTSQYGIPHDVQYGDIDIMERELDFTYSQENFAGLPEYIRELKARGIKFITILDPGISFHEPRGSYRPFDLGEEMDVWIKRPDGTPTVGIVWPGEVYFPDYSKNSTREWWITLIKEFKDLLDFDGLWIDMNEPASWGVGDTIQGCENNKINNPPYTPATLMGGNLQEQTICPDANQVFGRHYDTHSLYGWSESEPTLAGVRQALGKRGVTLTRSSFLGNGQWASHWLGDNFSRWSNLHYSIIGMLQFNHFGIPYVGADICGFGEHTTPEMCLRWQQLGAFYTFSRNHNAIGNPDQDPGNFGPDFAASVRKALLVRYTLLPYLYTLFHIHVTQGETVIRALWHEFSKDQTALGIDKQFLWGSGLLVSAVLDEGATSVNAYFPDARWFDYYTGSEVAARGQYLELDAPLDFVNVHVRGGIVYPTQVPAINTELARNNPFGLIVALDDAGAASGKLFVDDGDSIDTQSSGLYFEADYVVAAGVLTGSVKHDGFDVSSKVLDTVRLMGAGTITEVKLNGVVHPHFTNEPSGEVKITQLNAKLNAATFRLEWAN